MNHDWILDVLIDLEKFSEEKGLNKLTEAIKYTHGVGIRELELMKVLESCRKIALEDHPKPKEDTFAVTQPVPEESRRKNVEIDWFEFVERLRVGELK